MTAEEKIQKALNSGSAISELRVKRNQGELTPEVLEMCKLHIDQMLEAAKKYWANSAEYIKQLEQTAEQIKNDQEVLVIVSEFADRYEEIHMYTKFLDDKAIAHTVTACTVRHREADIAMSNKVIALLKSKNISDTVYSLIYAYGYRND